MSGGRFDHGQFLIEEIADKIETLISSNDVPNKWGGCRNYRNETLIKFAEAIKTLRIASIMVHRIDLLVSGDDGENDFHERLDEDITKEKNAGVCYPELECKDDWTVKADQGKVRADYRTPDSFEE